MLIQRIIADELTAAAGEYPVVTIMGPRQSGKTTLARMTFPAKPYFSFEEPDTRQRAEMDPRAFLAQIPEGAILDEIQRLPQLISYLQSNVDENQAAGRFILTGSHQPELHHAISQSLAGRTAMLTLLPFSYKELVTISPPGDVFLRIFSGGFPRLHDRKLDVNRFFNSYIQTYLERDVRALANIKDLSHFQHFMVLLAGRIGQVVNYATLSNDVGISSGSIRNWINILQASYLIFELPAWSTNISKRVIKAPKLYFTDTGIASFLLGIRDPAQLYRDPLRGGLYENFVILDIIKGHYNKGLRPELYFYRDSHGNEVDLLIKKGSIITPVEIKSAETFNASFLSGIEKFRSAVKQECTDGIVLYNGSTAATVRGIEIVNPLLHPPEKQLF